MGIGYFGGTPEIPMWFIYTIAAFWLLVFVALFFGVYWIAYVLVKKHRKGRHQKLIALGIAVLVTFVTYALVAQLN